MHRVDGGAAGPQHVGRVEDDGQRAGDVGAGLAAGHDRNRLDAGGQHLVDGGLLEAVQQLADGLVDAGDAGDGSGAGDDADLVGVIAGVMGLPQRVAAPPAAHVLVDDRDEVDGLAQRLAQGDEERDVRRVQAQGLGLGVPGQQLGDGALRIFKQRFAFRGGREQRVDAAGVGRVQAGLGALQHLFEAVAPGDVEPRRVVALGVGGAAAVADRELDVALQPLLVGHVRDVAEVRLRGVGHGGDDLVAALGDGVGVTGDLVEQAAAPRSGVVDLVDVRAQLATAGSHAALRLTGADPVVGALGVDEELLDLRRGGGLEGGHGGGTDQDAVDRHQREAVGLGPAAGQVLGGALGRADATTDADGQVGLLAQVRVGADEQVVEVLPRVVATGAAALDVNDDLAVRDLFGDLDDRLDLVHGARLEHHVGDADLVQFLDQRDGLVELGDTSGDDDTVDRGARLARLLHDALAAQLQLPQVRVQEQRVELDGAARLEQLRQLGDAVLEDLLGDLTATGQLGPVAGVGGRGDDLGVDGRRGHTGQQDRRTAGQAGELGGQLDIAVGQLDSGRREAGPRGLHDRCGTDGEQRTLAGAGRGGHDADAEAADDRRGQAGDGVTRAEVDDPAGTGVVHALDLGDPVDGLDEDGFGHGVGQLGVDTALGGPAVDDLDAVGQARGVEADLDLHALEDGAEDGAAAQLVLALGLVLLGDLAAVQLEAGQLLRGSGDDDAATAVADRQDRRQDGADVLGEVFEQFGDALGVDVGDRHHRRLVATADHAAAARHERAGGADELQEGEEFGVAGAVGLEGLGGDDALRVSGDRDRRGAGQVQALTLHGADGGHLGQQDAGAGDGGGGQLLGRGQRLVGGEGAHPLHGLEADGPHDDELARDGLEQQGRFADDLAELGFDAGRADELLEVLQPGGTLATERDGIGFAGIEQVYESMRARRHRLGVATGHIAVLVDRHASLSSLPREPVRCLVLVVGPGATRCDVGSREARATSGSRFFGCLRAGPTALRVS